MSEYLKRIRHTLSSQDLRPAYKSLALTFLYCFSLYHMGYVFHDNIVINSARTGAIILSVLSLNLLVLSVVRNRFLQVAYYILFISFLISNLLYYRYFEIQIKLGQLFAIGNLPQVTGYAMSLLRLEDLVFAIGLGGLVLLSIFKESVRPGIPIKVLLASIIVLSVVRVGVHIPLVAYTSGENFVKVAKGFVHSDNHLFTLRFGYSVGFLSDLYHLTTNMGSGNKLDGVKDYTALLTGDISGGAEEKPNIIIIQLESIDFNLIGLSYEGVEVTPYMNSLMKDSLSFSNYYTVRYTGSTSDAEFSILTSMQPLTDKPSFYARGFERLPSLPTVLSMFSYDTAAFHANKASFWGRSNAFEPLGIKRYFSLKDYDDLPKSGNGTVPDKYFLMRTLDFISEMPEPFYAHVLTISSHGPFNRLEFEIEDDLPVYREFTGDRDLNNYFRVSGHVDSLLKEFVQGLRDRFDDHIIVIVGDHTAQIRNDIYSSRGSGPGKVPFFIISNRAKVQRQINFLGNHLDVAPTITGLAKIPTPSSWQGTDLLSKNGDRETLIFKQPLISVDREGNFMPLTGPPPDALYVAERYLWH